MPKTGWFEDLDGLVNTRVMVSNGTINTPLNCALRRETGKAPASDPTGW